MNSNCNNQPTQMYCCFPPGSMGMQQPDYGGGYGQQKPQHQHQSQSLMCCYPQSQGFNQSMDMDCPPLCCPDPCADMDYQQHDNGDNNLCQAMICYSTTAEMPKDNNWGENKKEKEDKDKCCCCCCCSKKKCCSKSKHNHDHDKQGDQPGASKQFSNGWNQNLDGNKNKEIPIDQEIRDSLREIERQYRERMDQRPYHLPQDNYQQQQEEYQQQQQQPWQNSTENPNPNTIEPYFRKVSAPPPDGGSKKTGKHFCAKDKVDESEQKLSRPPDETESKPPSRKISNKEETTRKKSGVPESSSRKNSAVLEPARTSTLQENKSNTNDQTLCTKKAKKQNKKAKKDNGNNKKLKKNVNVKEQGDCSSLCSCEECFVSRSDSSRDSLCISKYTCKKTVFTEDRATSIDDFMFRHYENNYTNKFPQGRWPKYYNQQQDLNCQTLNTPKDCKKLNNSSKQSPSQNNIAVCGNPYQLHATNGTRTTDKYLMIHRVESPAAVELVSKDAMNNQFANCSMLDMNKDMYYRPLHKPNRRQTEADVYNITSSDLSAEKKARQARVTNRINDLTASNYSKHYGTQLRNRSPTCSNLSVSSVKPKFYNIPNDAATNAQQITGPTILSVFADGNDNHGPQKQHLKSLKQMTSNRSNNKQSYESESNKDEVDELADVLARSKQYGMNTDIIRITNTRKYQPHSTNDYASLRS